MRVVVGLGNPGNAYASTRHNVGFVVLAELERRWGLSLAPLQHGSRTVQGMVNGARVMLVEPSLFMNRSGAALVALQPPVTAEQLVVIHDDLDLECGRVQVKCSGGTGGHRGLASIVEYYGGDFTRVRLGIGRPPHASDPAAYVLAAFDAEQWAVVEAAVQRGADAVECIVRYGEEPAMNQFNVRSGTGLVDAAPMGRKRDASI